MMKSRPNLLVVLFTVVLGISISVPAGAQSTDVSKRVANLQTLYSYLVYPKNQQVFPAAGVSPVDALFPPTGAQGRIAPLGKGQDLATLKKYFFGLSPTDPTTAFFTVSGVDFHAITEQPPYIFVEVDVNFTETALGNSLGIVLSFSRLRETGRFTFDKQFRIVSFDLLIPYLDTAMALAGKNASDPSFIANATQAICSQAQQVCTTAQTGYLDSNACVAYLSSSPVQPGNWDRVSGTNTVICRAFHLPFVSIDPTVECPIIGTTGSTECADNPDYTITTYLDETF